MPMGEAEARAQGRQEAAPAAVVALLLFVVLAGVSRAQEWESCRSALVGVAPRGSSHPPVGDRRLHDLPREAGSFARGTRLCCSSAFSCWGTSSRWRFWSPAWLPRRAPSSAAANCCSRASRSGLPTSSFSGSRSGSLKPGLSPRVRAPARTTGGSSFPRTKIRNSPPAMWRPQVWDYMYVALTNGIAFSPTDAMPLSLRAKAMHGLSSCPPRRHGAAGRCSRGEHSRLVILGAGRSRDRRERDAVHAAALGHLLGARRRHPAERRRPLRRNERDHARTHLRATCSNQAPTRRTGSGWTHSRQGECMHARGAFGPLAGRATRAPAAPTESDESLEDFRGFLVKRTTGLEPATLGLGSQCSTS